MRSNEIIVSHMNAEHYVPISVIADFKRVKAVTRDMDEIVAALRRSSVVIVDETGTLVKPVPAKPRTTLIIRELPYNIEAKASKHQSVCVETISSLDFCLTVKMVSIFVE